MLKLFWIGHASFWVQEPVSIVIDPFDENVSSHFPAIQAQIVTESHQHFDHCAHGRVKGPFDLLSKAEKKTFPSVTVQGFPAFHDKEGGRKRGANILFKFTFPDGLTLLHSGDLGHRLNADEVKDLGKIDILCVPVGGTYRLDSVESSAFAEDVNPAVVVPMHFKTPLMSQLAELDLFLKSLGWPTERRQLLTVSKTDLRDAGKTCAVLSALIQEK